MRTRRERNENGQIVVLLAAGLTALILATGLVVDVGFAFSRQRETQNAADFAAMAGARVLGEYYTGKPAGAGTDGNVASAVNAALSANGATLASAQYVDQSGRLLGNVGGGINAGAVGVVVKAQAGWGTYFVRVIPGMDTWHASTSATAYTVGIPSAGVMPAGLSQDAFNGLPFCDPNSASFESCVDANGASASGRIMPGGFGWLKFGAQDKCEGFGLGMDENAGCLTSQQFLESEVGPPANSYGCCTNINETPDDARKIGSLTGNEQADFSYYITNRLIVWVPIWDYANPGGANGYYHIIGFGAIVFTGQDSVHGAWIQAVRVSASFGDTPNAVQLGATGEVHLVR
jgi:Flp pilus assembly protein TadG